MASIPIANLADQDKKEDILHVEDKTITSDNYEDDISAEGNKSVVITEEDNRRIVRKLDLWILGKPFVPRA